MRGDAVATLGVRGTGLLADAVRALRYAHALGVTAPPGLAMIAAVSDRWGTDHAGTRALAGRCGVPSLPVRTELGTVIIGPLESPGETGCAACADARSERARSDRKEHQLMVREHGDELSTTDSLLLGPLAGDLVASVVEDEFERVSNGSTPRTREALLYVDLHTLRIDRHAFLPDPRCPVCHPGTTRPPEFRLSSRPKPAREHYRAGTRPGLDTLTDLFVDPETGVVRTVEQDAVGGSMLAIATIGLRDNHRDRLAESGYGRTRNVPEGKAIAICEALERYGGLRQGDAPETVRAAYADITEEAIDIDLLGRHPDESYARPDFPYPPFDPHREREWVRGYSLVRKQPVLVPERLAHYGPDPARRPDAGVFFETSNGSALGGCLEEAILHGILEFLERDAFLMTWHARLPASPVALDSATDRTIPLEAHEISHRTGYRVTVFDTTLEHGVPSALAVAVRPPGRPELPAVCCSAGAHLTAEGAVRTALGELGPALDTLPGRYARERRRAAAMVDDPDLVRDMPDHSLLYSDDRAFGRFDFLRREAETLPIADAFGSDFPTIATHDLREDLEELVRRLSAHGFDVIVVDHTTSEHDRAGLRCVKVFVPGMLTMTFGHRYRRLAGIPRLYELPWRLGHTEAPRRDEDLNLHPHPFP